MTSKAVTLIEVERQRQVDKGWTPAKDDHHTDGSLTQCASEILHPSTTTLGIMVGRIVGDHYNWPEQRAAHVLKKYENDPIRRLIIAGALIVAEIERLQRLENHTHTPTGDT